MKKLSAEEKLSKLVEIVREHGQIRGDTVIAVSDCPYGDPSHRGPIHRGVTAHAPGIDSAMTCNSCSKLDGSECVDELLEAWDYLVEAHPTFSDYEPYDAARDRARSSRVMEKLQAVRAWRESKR